MVRDDVVHWIIKMFLDLDFYDVISWSCMAKLGAIAVHILALLIYVGLK